MGFSSAIFLFAFLPLSVALYRLVPKAWWRGGLLTAAGLVFYAFGRLSDVPVLLASVLVHYAAGLLLSRLQKGRRAVVAATVALDVGLLVFYKYLDFFLGGLLPSGLLPSGLLPHLPLPAGVSFFTFQGISYVVDAYRDRAQASRKFWPVLQYLTFFPNLISGPLQKFRDFAPQWQKRRVPSAEQTAAGLRRFTVGLAKKLLLAGALGGVADAVYALSPAALDIRTGWVGAVFYTLQLYFDFSGYSDMALGLAALFGFRLPENFNYPYLSGSISEFWRRWHMSLGGWFRDYLYIPLGGNRKGRARTVINKLVVFLATGLWHGANWTFVLWGLWHGLFITLETVTPLRKRGEKCWYGHAYTLLAVLLGFALFRAESLTQGFALLRAMFTGFSLTAASAQALTAALSRRALVCFVLALPLSLGLGPAVWRRVEQKTWAQLGSYALTLLLLALCVLALAGGGFQPFIYQQF